SGAAATALLSVVSVTVTPGGTGYTLAPSVTITGGALVNATATSVLSTSEAATFTGTTTMNTSLALGANNALPGSSCTLTLTTSVPMYTPNNILLNSNVTNVTLAGTMTLSGTINTSVANGVATLNVASGGTVTSTGAFGGTFQSVNKGGTGTLILQPTAANTY